jgi:hypothetical protein
VKTIIAGSRRLHPDLATITDAVVASGFDVTEVVCGWAEGVDKAGAAWAESRDIRVKHFPVEWKRYGRRAGPIRNTVMVEYADARIALWDGQSNGTRDTLRKAREAGLKVYVHTGGE